MGKKSALLGACFFLMAACINAAYAKSGAIKVAVASNFILPAREIVAKFEDATKIQVQLISGSTGKIFAQIVHGAPFDVFLSADQNTISQLNKKGLIDSVSQITYAEGRLVFWPNRSFVAKPRENKEQDNSLANKFRLRQIRRLALANPRLAPYGQAAESVIRALGANKGRSFSKPLQLIYGENVSQAFQFVQTESVDAGFVALSQVTHVSGWQKRGWLVPKSYHDPILQDAAIIKSSRQALRAKRFMDFLREEEAKKIINGFGYQVNVHEKVALDAGWATHLKLRGLY